MRVLLFALIGLGFAAAAHAETNLAAPEAPTSPLAPSATLALAPLDLDAMQAMRGGDDIAILVTNEQTQIATSANNTVSAETVTTGAITLSDGALQNFSGVGNFLFNSGNNNTLQGNLSVQVSLVP